MPRQPVPAPIGRSDVETLLMSELSNAFRGGAAREHISSLEAELTGMYTAVPKDASGGLGHKSVRYVLHRFFVQKYGWFIRGLEPGNFTAHQAAVVEILTQSKMHSLQEYVPNYLQEFLEDMKGDGRGINLRELAVLAATLEDLIHKESSQRLQTAFSLLELPLNTQLNVDQFGESLDVYLMIYMLGGALTLADGQSIMSSRDKIWDYDNVKHWMHTHTQVMAPFYGLKQTIDVAGASLAVDEIGQRYGTYNNAQCRDLKADLLQVESTKPGRVRLVDFYKKGLTGVFAFTEKREYLRALGLLDESNSSEPYVIITNYAAGRQNCLMASDFYLTCCRMSECQDLFASVEKKFQKPTANPKEILELVGSFSTETVTGPRTLPDTLVRRLHSIAESNHGRVPLHGRLFTQWMHHAFPRECLYPQLSGEATAMTSDEWIQTTGHESAQHTKEEIQVIVGADSRILPVGDEAREHHNLPENELPWDEVEELLHSATGPESDVVSLQAANPKATQRSLFGAALPMFCISGAAAFAWKMTRKMKGSKLSDDLMV